MKTVYLAPGLRTPFAKSGGPYSRYDALGLSAPIARAMAARARPDLIVWGEVIPEATVEFLQERLLGQWPIE
jgi:acetyl-CoA C-acetyltransferase/acetyl-CoA acyltransferase